MQLWTLTETFTFNFLRSLVCCRLRIEGLSSKQWCLLRFFALAMAAAAATPTGPIRSKDKNKTEKFSLIRIYRGIPEKASHFTVFESNQNERKKILTHGNIKQSIWNSNECSFFRDHALKNTSNEATFNFIFGFPLTLLTESKIIIISKLISNIKRSPKTERKY